MDSDKKVILGVLAGVAVGAALGILFAPDRGSNTRRKIAGSSEEYIDGLEAKFNKLLDAMTGKAPATPESHHLIPDPTVLPSAGALHESSAPIK